MKKKFYFVMLLCLFVLPLTGFSYMPGGGFNPNPGWENPQFELPDWTLPEYTPPEYSWNIPDFGVPHIPNIPFDPSSIYFQRIIVKNDKYNSFPKLSNSNISWHQSGSAWNSYINTYNLYDNSSSLYYDYGIMLGSSLFNDSLIYSVYNSTDNSSRIKYGKANDNSTLKSLKSTTGVDFYLYPFYSYGHLTYIKNNSLYKHYKFAIKSTKKFVPLPPDTLIASGVEVQPVINYKGNTVWTKRDNSSDDYEIMYYDGDNITQITNNSYDDLNPFIYKNIVVWQAYDGHDYEIMYWNGSTITQITNNDVDDKYPTVYNGTIAWSQKVGSDYEIMYWDGTTIHQITSDNDNNTNPYLYNGAIVWENHYGTNKSAIVYSVVDTPWIPAPTDHNAFSSYSASYSPVVKTLAKYCKPVGVGDVSNKKLHLRVRTPKFEEAVDIYFALKVPEFSSEYYLFKEGGGIQPLSQGLVAWKTNVTNEIDETIYNGSLTGFPKGHYNFYFIVVPKGSELLISPTPPYYFWQTSFELN